MVEEDNREVALKNEIQNTVSLRAPSQMAIAVEQVEQLLRVGWEFVANLPNGKVIVRNQT
jgi:hypothetical protein